MATDNEHGHGDKSVTIIVNGTPHEVDKNQEITFEQVAQLAYDPVPTGEFIVVSVTYSKGENDKQGTLLPGGSVKVKAGMVFNVTVTDKS